MRLGTKSLLFGAHCLPIHTVMVALAWRRLYGWPLDPRLWLAFVVHDLGYWGKKAMDDAEGERHVELGARFMTRWFGPKWGTLCLYHSRFYAARDKQPVSRLCLADKMAIVLTPAWLYLPCVKLTGEIKEYQALALQGKYQSEIEGFASDREWFRAMQAALASWIQQQGGRGYGTQ